MQHVPKWQEVQTEDKATYTQKKKQPHEKHKANRDSPYLIRRLFIFVLFHPSSAF